MRSHRLLSWDTRGKSILTVFEQAVGTKFDCITGKAPQSFCKIICIFFILPCFIGRLFRFSLVRMYSASFGVNSITRLFVGGRPYQCVQCRDLLAKRHGSADLAFQSVFAAGPFNGSNICVGHVAFLSWCDWSWASATFRSLNHVHIYKFRLEGAINFTLQSVSICLGITLKNRVFCKEKAPFWQIFHTKKADLSACPHSGGWPCKSDFLASDP
jgi:hypothetical protein